MISSPEECNHEWIDCGIPGWKVCPLCGTGKEDNKMTSSPKELTDERKATHGDWKQQSRCANELKGVMRGIGNWNDLWPAQQEALDMIATKMSRILSGNPNEPDHWDDIAGYAYLGKGGHGA